MTASLIPRRSMSSRRQLVLEAIRRHFLALGAAPSYRDIAEATGLQAQHVGRQLAKLQAAGELTYTPGTRHSIRLTPVGAGLSDTQLELVCIARGWTVSKPALPLAAAFPISESVTELGLPLVEALKHIE